jgi:hypothetical protein
VEEEEFLLLANLAVIALGRFFEHVLVVRKSLCGIST